MDPKHVGQEALQQSSCAIGWYRHVKGNAYVAYSISVHEATGEVLVSYFSPVKRFRWTRVRSVFEERFTWWRPATFDELGAAAFGGEEILRRVFGDVERIG
jgi:hypothetical protein